MRPMQIFIIALLASCAAAAGAGIELQLAGAGSALSLGSNLSYAQAQLNNSTYYILFANESPAAAFLQQGQNISLLRQQKQIAPVLLSYYSEEGVQAQAIAALNEGHAAISQFESAANGQGVKDCRRITGTDRHACDTYENCRFACYSVTSYCYPIALGAGRSFIEEIWKFTNNTRDLNGAIANEKAAYSAAVSGTSSQSLAAYILAFNNASKIANDLENSVLVNWICPSQGFDMVAMSKAGDSLARASLSLESYEDLDLHAGIMEHFANNGGAIPKLSALEPIARGVSTCQIRVEHFITSGNITSIVSVKLETSGDCNLSGFGLRERIPENFSYSVEVGRFSIPPISLDNRAAYWEFDSLQDGQVLVLTYSTDGWVGYSRVKYFNSTQIYLLSPKPLLQNHDAIPISLAFANSGNKTAGNANNSNANNATSGNANGNSAAANNAPAANENKNNANAANANEKTAGANKNSANDKGANTGNANGNSAGNSALFSNTLLLVGAGAIVLAVIAAIAYLLFFRRKGGKKGM